MDHCLSSWQPQHVVSSFTTAMALGLLRFVYALNIAAAGSSGLLNLAGPSLASRLLWEGSVAPWAALPLLGAMWVTVAALSAAGLAQPLAFRRAADCALCLPSPPAACPNSVLGRSLPCSALPLFQLVYKSLFLGLVVLPAWLKTGSTGGAPLSLVLIFGAYVPLLAAAIPWGHLLRQAKGRAKAE